jgi:hypothetical protein
MKKLKKYQFRANVQGRIDGPDEESCRQAVASQVSLSINLAKGASAVSVELVLVSAEQVAREEALAALGKKQAS